MLFFPCTSMMIFPTRFITTEMREKTKNWLVERREQGKKGSGTKRNGKRKDEIKLLEGSTLT